MEKKRIIRLTLEQELFLIRSLQDCNESFPSRAAIVKYCQDLLDLPLRAEHIQRLAKTSEFPEGHPVKVLMATSTRVRKPAPPEEPSVQLQVIASDLVELKLQVDSLRATVADLWSRLVIAEAIHDNGNTVQERHSGQPLHPAFRLGI